MTVSLPWFALQVRTNREKSVYTALCDKDFETYLPLFQERRVYAGKVRQAEVPCFPGYVFCRLDPDNRLPVLKTPDVYRLLGTGKEPESILESDIQNIRILTSSAVPLERCPYVTVGDQVQVVSGPLTGLQGILMRVKTSQRIVISVGLLRRSVSAEVEMQHVIKHPLSFQNSSIVDDGSSIKYNIANV